MERFNAVNGAEIKRLRIQRGWTQQEFGQVAGYSDRLIRKAESNGRLEIETIRNLAQALTSEGSSVTLEQLMVDNLAMAQQFVYGYDHLGKNMLAHVEPTLAKNFVFHVAGDPTTAPFIGDWHGTAGFCEFLEAFFGLVSRQSGSLNAAYTSGVDTVSARYVDTLFVAGQPNRILWTNLHFYFADGLIVRIEDQYDTNTAAVMNVGQL